MSKVFYAAALFGLNTAAALPQTAAQPTPVRTTPAQPAVPPAGSSEIPKLTEDGGQPVGNNQNSRTAGPRGPVTIDNFHLIQKLARFDRERIPERVVHARGAGAQGVFESYGDQSAITKANLFGAAGRKTPVFVRFSLVIHPSGSPESLRDPRGFAVKFYTQEGNWDLVGNDLPVFFIRDGMKFPDLIHAFKPSPITNVQDQDRIFDFLSHQPESTHMIAHLWSDMGTPANYRQMDGFGVNALKMINAKGEATYVKFNWRTMQGIKGISEDEARAKAAVNHSFATEDLYDHIKAGKFPSWELGIQTLKPADLEKFDFDPLDDTKMWPGVPETKIGKMTLNKVPDNFFEFTEQAAFCPGMVVPGIEPSEDRLLQGRIFSYADTQRYRVGTNYLDLPVNRPLATVSNNNQNGLMDFDHRKSDTNYEPSVRTGGRRDDSHYQYSDTTPAGKVEQKPIAKTADFRQAGELYRSFNDKQKAALIKNLSGDLNQVKVDSVKKQIVVHCYKADADFGTRLAKETNVNADEIKKMAMVAEAPRAR